MCGVKQDGSISCWGNRGSTYNTLYSRYPYGFFFKVDVAESGELLSILQEA